MRRGLTPADLAAEADVDPKTAERWVTQGRTPYPRHRHVVGAMLGEAERYLWPDALSPDGAISAARSELVALYPHRSAVPSDMWRHLLDGATTEIAILVYVGMFLTEQPKLSSTLRSKGKAGVRVRLLFGDPASRQVVRRSEEEGIGKGSIPAKVRNVLAYFQTLDGADGVEVRCHGTTLYNSVFRYDAEMIVNLHVYGFGAPHAPALHLRRLSGGDLFNTYARSFEQVWAAAKRPAW